MASLVQGRLQGAFTSPTLATSERLPRGGVCRDSFSLNGSERAPCPTCLGPFVGTEPHAHVIWFQLSSRIADAQTAQQSFGEYTLTQDNSAAKGDSTEDPPDQAVENAKAEEWYLTDVAEHYADTINVAFGPFGASLTFGVRRGAASNPNVRVHMSHQMAVVLERLLRRIITNHEVNTGTAVFVAPDILEGLRLRDEDMKQWDQLRRGAMGPRRKAKSEDS